MLEPQDFGGIYHAIWDEICQGDFEACRSLIKSLQVMAESKNESDRLGAKTTLRDLSSQLHEQIRTQELLPFENLERHQYEELLMMLEKEEE